MKVALATCERPPVPDLDAELLVPLVEARGAVAETPAWSDPAVDWRAYDRVVISSTWDYHDRLEEFRAWLRAVSSAGVRLDNPAELVEWNLDKRYLRELEDAGVPVIRTVWGGRGDAESTGRDAAEHGWDRVVVKPAVDLGAMNLVRTDAGGVADAAASIAGDHLVQPYLPSLEDEGELSIVHFDGEVSHALVKTPAAGDFRVQPLYGGSFHRVEPEPDTLDIASRALETAPGGRALYARVDLVRDLDGRWCCIELELIEPALFLGVADQAAERLATLLLSPS